MMRCAALASLCFVCLFLLSCQSSFGPQEEQGKDQPNPIEGDWTEVIRDRGDGGGVWSTLPEPLFPYNTFGRYYSIRWKIAQETIEWGKDIKGRFPEKRYTYKLIPARRANAIDISLDEVDLDIADKDNRRQLNARESAPQPSIFFVNGDYLMICMGVNSRPPTFVADDPHKDTTIRILRRGRLYQKDGKDIIGPMPNDKYYWGVHNDDK
jgi:hypothetical protein